MRAVIQVGDNVGGYEILSKLSQGGMATLYLATRGGASGFSKHVAVKVVHEHLAVDQTFVEMFVDEALLSARIHHPNVVHIEELRELDGQHFLVMEYVSGVSLHQLVRRLSRLGRRMTPELAVYIAVQVADGLHAAHELKDANGRLEGLVHRDVSPQNVLLAWEGYVKLIDFGVAKARSRFQQTTSASLKGKVRYMAPEQARGLDVDRRTDVYALGIVLWEMLTMRPRFEGANDFALLDQVRSPEHVPVRAYNAAVSPGLDAVLKKALSPQLQDRFPTAQEFRRALAIAVPSALALDATHLSDLVRAACAEELGEARDQLPHSMVLPEDVGSGDEIERAPLRTLTVSASQVLGFAEDSLASHAPNTGRTAATVSHSSLLRPSAPSPPQASPPPPPPPSSAPPPVPAYAQPNAAQAGVPGPNVLESARDESFTLPPRPPRPPATSARSSKIMGVVLFVLFLGASLYVLFPPSTNAPRVPTSPSTDEVPAPRPDAAPVDAGQAIDAAGSMPVARPPRRRWRRGSGSRMRKIEPLR